MPENNVVAIDFGTSRTKLAYCDPKTRKVVLMHHGIENYLPSYFAVDENGDILVGDVAQKMFESKESRRRTVSNIKGQISELSIKFGPFSTKTPPELLTALFTHLKKAVKQQNIFESTPEIVYLTHPSTFKKDERVILEASAQAAGFSFELIEEPIAAARFVEMSEEDLPTDIIVLDCGAGTLQWMYLHQQYIYRDKPKYIREEGESGKLKAGGTRNVGGRNIEAALARTLQSRLGNRMKEGARITEDDFEFLCHEAKLRKEKFCRNPNDEPRPIEIEENFSVRLSARNIESAIEEHYITPACNAVEPYINNVVKETGRKPALVLTGGCAHIKNFAPALYQKFGLDCITIPDFEYATVRGAIPVSEQRQTQQNERIETVKSEFESKPSEHQEMITAIKKTFDTTVDQIGHSIDTQVTSCLLSLVDESNAKWKDLDIGGTETTYLWDADVGFAAVGSGHERIKQNIISYFVENLSETLDKKIEDELDEIIGDLFSRSGVDLFSRSGEMLSQAILSETSVQSKEVVKQTVSSLIDEILIQIDIEEQIKGAVQGHIVWRYLLAPASLIQDAYLAARGKVTPKENRTNARREYAKSLIHKELRKGLFQHIYSTTDGNYPLSHVIGIQNKVVKVFRATFEKLQ